MIEEAYVNFETAKLLKEKGFMEGAIIKFFASGYDSKGKILDIRDTELKDYPRPTQQMAIRWLREVHNIVIVIDVCRETGKEGFYCWQLEDSHTGDNIVNIVGECPTYEQAAEVAIKYCLKNLI